MIFLCRNKDSDLFAKHRICVKNPNLTNKVKENRLYIPYQFEESRIHCNVVTEEEEEINQKSP